MSEGKPGWKAVVDRAANEIVAPCGHRFPRTPEGEAEALDHDIEHGPLPIVSTEPTEEPSDG